MCIQEEVSVLSKPAPQHSVAFRRAWKIEHRIIDLGLDDAPKLFEGEEMTYRGPTELQRRVGHTPYLEKI